MKIFPQKKHNDCAIAILKSLYFYLYRNEVSEAMILNDYQMSTKEGISLYDLEILADKINIFLQSYEATFQ